MSDKRTVWEIRFSEPYEYDTPSGPKTSHRNLEEWVVADNLQRAVTVVLIRHPEAKLHVVQRRGQHLIFSADYE